MAELPGAGSVLNLPTLGAESSDLQTTSQLIYSGPCLMTCCKVFTNGVNDVTIDIYDALTESGNVVDRWFAVGADKWGGGVLQFPLVFQTGLYAKITGTGGSFIMHFRKLQY